MSVKQAILLPLCLLLLGSQFAFAQTKKRKFGEVDESYIHMASYPADTNAGAVYLYDYGEAAIVGDATGLKRVYKFHQQVKILSESEVDRGDYVITFHKKTENVSKIEGMTYNVAEDGSIEKLKLTKKDIYKEDVDGEYQRYRFSLPKVKKGSVIELSYEKIEEGFRSIDTWYFQTANVPVIYSEYKTIIPEWFSFTPLLNGALPLTEKPTSAAPGRITIGLDGGAQANRYVTLSPRFITTSYVMKDVPAFIAEPYLTTAMDHISWLKFQLTTITWPESAPEDYLGSWGKLEEALLQDESFGLALNKLGKLKKWESPTSLSKLSQEEKAKAILDYVSGAMEWTGYYSFVAEGKLDEIHEKRKGNSGDINLLLIALLRKEGIDAHPVLLSTRSHGKMQDVYPLVSQFNHVIALAQVDSLWIPMDAISENLAFGMLTRDDLNQKGFLVMKGASQWVDIIPSFTDKRVTRAMVVLNEENSLSVNMNITCMEYDSYDIHREFSKHEKDEDKFIESFFEDDYSDIEMESYEFQEKSRNKFAFTTQYTTSEYLNEVGDMFYLRPLLHDAIEENFFKLKERNYPVDFGTPIDWQYNLTIILPEDVEFEAMPKPTRVALPNGDGEFLYNFAQNANMINLVSNIKIHKTLFLPDEYQALKNFFDLIVEKQAEQLVFRRKS